MTKTTTGQLFTGVEPVVEPQPFESSPQLYYSGELLIYDPTIIGGTQAQATLYHNLGFGHGIHLTKHLFAPGPYNDQWRARPEYLYYKLNEENDQWKAPSSPKDGLYWVDIEFDAAWKWYRTPNLTTLAQAYNGFEIIKSCIEALKEVRPDVHIDLFNVVGWLDLDSTSGDNAERVELVAQLHKLVQSASQPLWIMGTSQWLNNLPALAEVLSRRAKRGFLQCNQLEIPLSCWFWRLRQGGVGGTATQAEQRWWVEHWLKTWPNETGHRWAHRNLFGGGVIAPSNEFLAKLMRHFST